MGVISIEYSCQMFIKDVDFDRISKINGILKRCVKNHVNPVNHVKNKTIEE